MSLGHRKGGSTDDRENIAKWDMQETAKGGPFQEIVDGELRSSRNCSQLTLSRHLR